MHPPIPQLRFFPMQGRDFHICESFNCLSNSELAGDTNPFSILGLVFLKLQILTTPLSIGSGRNSEGRFFQPDIMHPTPTYHPHRPSYRLGNYQTNPISNTDTYKRMYLLANLSGGGDNIPGLGNNHDQRFQEGGPVGLVEQNTQKYILGDLKGSQVCRHTKFQSMNTYSTLNQFTWTTSQSALL